MVIQLRGGCEPERGKDRVELRSDETDNVVVYPRPGFGGQDWNRTRESRRTFAA